MNSESIPKCVGVIMDGNRRWAKARSLNPAEGHRSGLTALRELVSWAGEAGVENVIAYSLSTENWRRDPMEVTALLSLIEEALRTYVKELVEKGVRVRFVGDIKRFPSGLQTLFKEAEAATGKGQNMSLILALSYGGRLEIIQAINRILEKGKTNISEEEFSSELWTGGIPDPDLIIRTGGQERLSNFLPWQSVYSELFFTKTLWPDFSKEEFFAFFSAFEERKRNFGA